MHPILGDRRRLGLFLLAWLLAGTGLALLLRTWIGMSWSASLAFSLPLALVAAPMSLSAWYLCRSLPLTRASLSRVGVTAVMAALVTAAIWAAAGWLWGRALEPAGFSLGSTPDVAVVTLLVGLGALGYLLSLTVHYLLLGVEQSAETARQLLQSDIAAREAELRALRAQLDPHFLFNALNSVAGLIAADPGKARVMCQRLADFLRDSLLLGRSERIILGREVALAEQYLQIEQVRFGPRLAVHVDLAPETREVLVPPLLLQPLVENAVAHGISTLVEGGTVEIRTTRTGDLVVVVITNPRDPDVARRGTGFGLDIVRRRLSTAFGDQAALAVEAKPEAYRVAVTLPTIESSS